MLEVDELIEEVMYVLNELYMKMEAGFPPHFLSCFSALHWQIQKALILLSEVQLSEALRIFYKELIIVHDEENGAIFPSLRWLHAACRWEDERLAIS